MILLLIVGLFLMKKDCMYRLDAKQRWIELHKDSLNKNLFDVCRKSLKLLVSNVFLE